MELVSKEIATKEVTAWLDFKKISKKKRESYAGVIEAMIALVMDGTFVIQPETFIIEHTLNTPLGSTGQIKKLNYKPRLTVSALQDNLNGVDNSDAIQLTLSYIMALSGEARAILRGLDTEDYGNADKVAVFFAIAN